MKKKRTARQKAIIKRRIFLTSCAAVLVAAIALIAFTVNAVFSHNNGNTASDKPSASQNSSSESDKTPYKVASASVVSTGDILVHSTQIDGARNSSTGEYDFSAFFKEAAPYFNKYDLAVANLEVTLGGTESGKYSGYPAFNTPDSLADTIKSSGISLLLTANNHCYDTGLFGLKRTVQVLKQRGLSFVGTKETTDDPTYLVKNVNGIKIGIACYTYETKGDTPSRKYLNGGIISSDANALVNSFSYQHIDDFYNEAQSVVNSMKNDGADFIVFYMHWGEEYQLTANTWQKTIAQKLTNYGVQMIIGGHPHVVQPMELIHSEDSQNTAVCLYSMGNAVSNQRQELMSPECTTGHTEDGVLFSFSLDKYSDGTTALTSVDIIPTWVDKYKGGSGYQYTVYPLESENDGAAKYGLSGTAASKSAASYLRTKELVGQSLTECQQYLGCEITFQ